MPLELKDEIGGQEVYSTAVLPACHVSAHEWIDVTENGKWLTLLVKPGLAEFMYGKWAPYFDPWIMMNMSPGTTTRLGQSADNMYLGRPNIIRNFTKGMGDNPMMHLMMDGATDSYASGEYGPVLHSYVEGDTKIEPSHLHFHTLKDSYNTGDHSDRQTLLFWIQGSDGQRKYLTASGNSKAEISLELQWRRIILTGTATRAGKTPKANGGQ